ncbi:MAG: sugar phosphate nucleotidyltransferase [Propionicimonas sp.]|uniref:sugar phosphate nucleotidyltransferase n=1 Tax=Propionicimonas sp. TaxID=1955623 RepID=UPI002B1F9D98|nr:sugar phosphate nucleotidyltransferase [Propionicimonas sp.]MEA4944519.1 sugar phosphate nucleotidyltransferase [Propionicimonas sp.]
MARGLGSRMRTAAAGDLTVEQAAAAASGAKAMMPLAGRPFLDHVLTRLADAGLTDVCLVIGPEHAAVREYYDALRRERVQISYAVQAEPLGTADAVAAAAEFAGRDRFVVVNGDNLYPAESLRRLVAEPGLATVGFRPEGLVANANIPADRMAAFALLMVDRAGSIIDVIEKPSEQEIAALGTDRLVSMNCWLLGPRVFEACAAIERSPRGELELVDAVRWLVAAGERISLVQSTEGVWDLSSRGDVADVARALTNDKVRL